MRGMIEVQIGEVASYSAAGVDVDAGDKISQLWQQAARQTYGNRADRLGQLTVSGTSFTDIRGLDLNLLEGRRDLILNGGVDGVGTKPELAERQSDRLKQIPTIEVQEEHREHAGIFHDAVAMVADDIARDGGEPVAIYTIFDARFLTVKQAETVVKQLGQGAMEACKLAEIVYPNGETAELGSRVNGYGEFNYNLGAFAIGATHKERALNGQKIQTGDQIIALREHGFRANGISLVRKVLSAEFGSYWHLKTDLAQEALKPSIIYTSAFVDMHGGYRIEQAPKAEVHAIIHVTGGGIPGKLQRKLAAVGKGAVLEDLFDPPEIMQKVQDWSMHHNDLATPDTELYQALNGGNGALVITNQPEEVIEIAASHDIDAKVAGEIVDETGIKIKSKGLSHPGEWINFIPRTE
jgi:phosphoribosylformylglycinamidine cyclo-ligase